MLGVKPSYSTGFAQWPGMSEYPQLWEGLVGAWDMSLGATGGQVFDLSGRTNQGTIYGTVVWNSYSNGTCLYWPGSAGDYIEMPAKSIGANQGTVIIAGQRDGGGGGYLFAHQNGNNRLYAAGSGQIAIAVADTGFTLVDNTNMVADTPFEFALTYNNGTWVAYQDGTQRDTGAYTGSISSLASTWRIGDHPTDHNIWDGYIFWMFHYNRALSSSEIAQLCQLRKRLA